MSMFYLSFTDPDRPRGTQWLGASIVEADDLPGALTTSHLLGCNPGGEVAALELPEGTFIRPDYLNRLLSEEEAERAGTRDS